MCKDEGISGIGELRSIWYSVVLPKKERGLDRPLLRLEEMAIAIDTERRGQDERMQESIDVQHLICFLSFLGGACKVLCLCRMHIVRKSTQKLKHIDQYRSSKFQTLREITPGSNYIKCKKNISNRFHSPIPRVVERCDDNDTETTPNQK